MPENSDKSTYASAAFLGKAAAVDEDNFISPLQWKPKVVAKTTDYTVTHQESGTYFTTEGATAAVNFTLPAASDGPWSFNFFNAEDVDMTVTAATADTMVTFNDVAADSVAYATSGEKVGGAFEVFSGGGAVVYVKIFPMSLVDQTVTIATA